MTDMRGTVHLGRNLELLADFEVKSGEPSELKLSVQASPATMTPNSDIDAAYEDLQGAVGQLVPARFSDRPFLDGYYWVTGVDLSHEAYRRTSTSTAMISVLNGQLGLTRAGSGDTLTLESRLSGSQTRTNEHGLTGDRWHAPPPGHFAYNARDFMATSIVPVTGAEGALTVYRGLPSTVSPRWGCDVPDYGRYRVRLLDALGRERVGTRVRLIPPGWPTAATGWSMSNGLVKVRWNQVGLRVSVWSNTRWVEKTWVLFVGDHEFGTAERVSVIRNDYEQVTVRLVWSRPDVTTQCDLTLRRGARWLEGHVQVNPITPIGITIPGGGAGELGAGYVRAAADDANGNRFVMGSPRDFVYDLAVPNFGLDTTAFPFMLGVEIGGDGAAPDYDATHLFAEYLGTPAERVEPVRA